LQTPTLATSPLISADASLLHFSGAPILVIYYTSEMKKEFYRTKAAAARATGLSRPTIYRYLACGDLSYDPIKGIPASDLACLVNRPNRRGRPVGRRSEEDLKREREIDQAREIFTKNLIARLPRRPRRYRPGKATNDQLIQRLDEALRMLRRRIDRLLSRGIALSEAWREDLVAVYAAAVKAEKGRPLMTWQELNARRGPRRIS
jgi:hypothetical protein